MRGGVLPRERTNKNVNIIICPVSFVKIIIKLSSINIIIYIKEKIIMPITTTEETDVFENLIITEQILNQQGLSLPASTNSTETIYKQLWAIN
jgi:hypothetical protein